MSPPSSLTLPTPCFVIRERDLLRNLEPIARLRQLSGAKALLALKCFSTWGVFPLLRPHLDGTTSSSPFEARLGFENFGGETHAYSVAYSETDVRQVVTHCQKIIFNSPSQLQRFRPLIPPEISIGLRINPEISYARQDKANPARPYSRLGVRLPDLTPELLQGVEGAMFHMNCENGEFPALQQQLETISNNFGQHLNSLEWVSLGGGIAYSNDGYPLEALAALLKQFSTRHQVQIYLEPGEAVVTKTTDMIVTVLDIVHNEKATAIVDSATEAHRLDTLIFNEPPAIREATPDGRYEYFIGSNSCLAGDIFCTARFPHPLEIGDCLHIMDAGGYTMVKLNWFNGLAMPSVYCERLDGRIETLNQFHYQDYLAAMSRRSVNTAQDGNIA
jgi:carboxynorspermidine decarboxylase